MATHKLGRWEYTDEEFDQMYEEAVKAAKNDGAALHWEKLDTDFLVESLLLGSFGGKTWMRALREGRDPVQALREHQAALQAKRPQEPKAA